MGPVIEEVEVDEDRMASAIRNTEQGIAPVFAFRENLQHAVPPIEPSCFRAQMPVTRTPYLVVARYGPHVVRPSQSIRADPEVYGVRCGIWYCGLLAGSGSEGSGPLAPDSRISWLFCCVEK